MGAAVLFLFIAYFIIKAIKKDKFALFEILGAMGFLIGFYLLITAPGKNVRLELIIGIGGYTETFLVRYIGRFINVTEIFIHNHGFLLMAISVILGFDLVYHQKRKLPIFSYFYALAALAGSYSMLLAPYYPDRAFLIVLVFSVITLGNVLVQRELQMPMIIKRNAALILAIVLIPSAFTFLIAGKAVAGVYLRWYDRLEYILAEKEKGNLSIEVRPIIALDKHVALYGLADILDDEDEWPNPDIAEYFGIESIKANDEGPLESVFQEKRNRIRQLFVSPWGIIERIQEIE